MSSPYFKASLAELMEPIPKMLTYHAKKVITSTKNASTRFSV